VTGLRPRFTVGRDVASPSCAAIVYPADSAKIRRKTTPNGPGKPLSAVGSGYSALDSGYLALDRRIARG